MGCLLSTAGNTALYAATLTTAKAAKPDNTTGRQYNDATVATATQCRNPAVKLDDIKKLHQKKYRQSLGHFLVEGEHLVLELEKAATGNPHWQQAKLFVTSTYEHWPSPWPKTIISDRQMAQLADTKTPQGILAVAPLPPIRQTHQQPAGKRSTSMKSRIRETWARSCAPWPGLAACAACSAPAASIPIIRKLCAPAWAPSSMSRWKPM